MTKYFGLKIKIKSDSCETNNNNFILCINLHRVNVIVLVPEAEGSIDVLLAEKDINIEANTDLGWSPLQLAAKAGSYHAVRSLVKAGADVNSTDMTYGRTALHIAVEGGHKDILEFLLKNVGLIIN